MCRICCKKLAILLVAVSCLGQTPTADTPLHRAATSGDLAALRSLVRAGADLNARGAAGQSPLLYAVAAGQTQAAYVLLAAGADVDALSSAGRTALMEAAERGNPDVAVALIARHADLDITQRGTGSALEAAERAGHNDLAAVLRKAGARSSGKSVGDKVCVRPWQGDGYCGNVEAIDKTIYRILLTEVVGCLDGCAPRAECSEGKTVGGPRGGGRSGKEGLHAGDVVATVSWCLTHTGVPK